MSKYTFFWNGPFSNWALSNFKYRGNSFMCAEQAMMWEKAMFFEDIFSASMIMSTADPAKQKALGRTVKNYNDEEWAAVRYNIVLNILRHKFTQDEYMHDKLMDTAGTILVEASPYDKIWGIGLGEYDPRALNEDTWQGQNLLGKALTQVRTEFENEGKQNGKAT